jgi:hypothetical protein
MVAHSRENTKEVNKAQKSQEQTKKVKTVLEK